jgi:cytochrome c oxidase subunit III
MATVTSVATVGRQPERHETATPLGIGVTIWLASELMFFAGLFAAYFTLKAHNEPVWPPPDVHFELWRTGLFTVVLVVSSLTMHFAVQSAERNRRQLSMWLMISTVVLGALFLTNQLLEYSALDFTIDSNAYATIYYTLTGFHALHVAAGLVALVMVTWVVFSRASKVPSAHTLRVTGYYWHLVDVVWIAVFLTVFILR